MRRNRPRKDGSPPFIPLTSLAFATGDVHWRQRKTFVARVKSGSTARATAGGQLSDCEQQQAQVRTKAASVLALFGLALLVEFRLALVLALALAPRAALALLLELGSFVVVARDVVPEDLVQLGERHRVAVVRKGVHKVDMSVDWQREVGQRRFASHGRLGQAHSGRSRCYGGPWT